ncbi:MAG: hypothetical protein R8P61_11415 [Bacteroidia bacterium]|nr:hypothetical protein [Bacteroidia bacterium]
MKRYLRGWIYSKILDGRKLMMLASFLIFYLGLSLSPLDNPTEPDTIQQKPCNQEVAEHQTWLD